MQVTELESKGLKKSFKIVVEASQIDAQMEVELKAAGERVKIPGFRPGFIPLKVLKQRFGKNVQADVLKQVINRSSNDVMTQKKIRPAMMPKINIEDYKEGGELTYTMSLESFPEVPAIAFDKLTLDRNTFDIEEKDIDEAVARLAERAPKLARAKEGSKAASGQVVTIDFKGMLDGKPFPGGAADNFNLELGSKQFIEGFEDQLIGSREGDDKIVKVTFPKDYGAADLAGKEASFAVKVKEIHNKEIPVVDDQFAKDRGFGDVRAFREAVRNQLIKEYDMVVRRQLKRELFDQMEEAYDFELPQGMLEMEFNTIWERLKQAKTEGDESVAGKSDDELKSEYEQIARRRVKLGILLAEIGNRNNIQVSREELGRAVMQQANQFPGQEKQVMEFYRNHPERAEDLRGPILEEKAVDFVLTKVKFSDHKVTLEELVADDGDESGQKKKSAKKGKSSEGESAKPKAQAKKKAAGQE